MHFFLVGGELVCICIAAIIKVFGQALAPVIVSAAHIRIEEIPFQGGHANPRSGSKTLGVVSKHSLPAIRWTCVERLSVAPRAVARTRAQGAVGCTRYVPGQFGRLPRSRYAPDAGLTVAGQHSHRNDKLDKANDHLQQHIPGRILTGYDPSKLQC